jgi:hypothetical protein
MIGNELNATFKSDPAFWAWVDKVGGMIKGIAPNKITTVALIDDSFESIDEANRIGPKEGGKAMPHIDVWGLNNYRGDSSPSGPNHGFTEGFWSGYESRTGKPLLMTEWGVPASVHVPDQAYPAGTPQELPNDAAAQEVFIRYHYEDMVQHSTVNKGISSGGTLFIWADQWDKQECSACSDRTHDGTASGPAENFPGNWWDEEWFGIQSVTKDPNRPWDQNWDVNNNRPYPPDTLHPRAAYSSISKLFTQPDPEVNTSTIAGAAGDPGFVVPIAPGNGSGEGTDLEPVPGGDPGTLATANADAMPTLDSLDPNTLLENQWIGESVPWADLVPLEITSAETVQTTFSLQPNRLEGMDANWYASAIAYPSKGSQTYTIYHFSPDGVWEEAQDQDLVLPGTPSYAGDLFQLEDFEIFSGMLPPGYYEFIFALSVLRSDWSGFDLHIDGEAVHVTEE